ncbi:MAG: hypothetical protein OZSIB_0743 [Candidatus Ozemobacter sibiricus]|uniref:Uncharacterized protein n=1 Tax=Candidatus Ozemobacter sibiricus TaxID=2268124 RepID=A0A367ZV66_9BACT|nr:MAG: hypothetical protein OZSIB_0743 [Candidatus Ozemobacter sibiricus]
MRVGSGHEGDPAIEVPRQSELFRGGFGMEVDHHRHPGGKAGQQSVSPAERAIGRIEEDSPLQVEHRQRRALRVFEHGPPLPRQSIAAQVVRAQGPPRPADRGGPIRPSEEVIAAGEQIDAGSQQPIPMVRGQASPARGILAVGDDPIEAVTGPERRHQASDHGPPGGSVDVADHQDAHAPSPFLGSLDRPSPARGWKTPSEQECPWPPGG